MKKFNFYIILCTVFFFASCVQPNNPDEPNIPDSPIEPEEPALEITTSNGQIVVPAEGGEIAINYEITNPATDGVVTLDIPAENEWITNPVVNPDTKTVVITVLQNIVKESRDETITLTYTYGDNSISVTAFIYQQENIYDYITECSVAVSHYWGAGLSSMNPDLHLHYLTLQTHEVEEGDVVPNLRTYYIDLWNLELSEDRLPLPGQYTMVPSMSEIDFCCTDLYSYCELIGEDIINFSDYSIPFFIGDEGEVVVKREGSIYTIKGSFTDTDGLLHSVSYTGELPLVDETVLSSLDQDITTDFSNYYVSAIYWADYYETELNYWSLQLMPVDIKSDDHFLFLEVLTPLDINIETGFNVPVTFVDIYTYDADPEATSCYIPGIMNEVNSWFFTCDYANSAESEIYFKPPTGPCITGPITLTPENDGTYTISADIFDDLGYNIKITGSGIKMNYYDLSVAPASLGHSAHPVYLNGHSTPFNIEVRH